MKIQKTDKLKYKQHMKHTWNPPVDHFESPVAGNPAENFDADPADYQCNYCKIDEADYDHMAY